MSDHTHARTARRLFARAIAALAAASVLSGCARYQAADPKPAPSLAGAPAYVTMGAGDRLGMVVVENRVFIARRNGEDNAYAAVNTADFE
ncbi:MAG: hypothetical protein HRU70_05580 [Phycisphaeraceae bacterium]|nr:MAG: hypothetical protein HRU70_05580 [Phycisphaeraceae bacterium]